MMDFLCRSGGLMFKPGGCNLQHATALSFLLIVYSRYLQVASRSVHCGSVVATPSRLVEVAKTQVFTILSSPLLAIEKIVVIKIKKKKSNGALLDAGGLHTRKQSIRDVVHGWIWPKIPTENSSPRIELAFHVYFP